MSLLVFQLVFCLQLIIQSSSLFLITCPYHLSLPLLMTVVIDSTPTSLLNSSLVLLSFMEIPHIHLIICISALLNIHPTSHSKGIVSLPKVMLLLTQLASPFISSGGSLDVRNGKSSRNFIHPFLILAVAARSAPPSPSRVYPR